MRCWSLRWAFEGGCHYRQLCDVLANVATLREEGIVWIAKPALRAESWEVSFNLPLHARDYDWSQAGSAERPETRP